MYSTLNPLIIPFGCIYYALAYVSGCYNLVYVFTPNRQGEGSLFPSIFTRLVWSLIVYQLSLAGILGLALFPAAAAIAVLVVISLFFWLYTDAQLHQTATNGVILTELSSTDVDPLATTTTTTAPTTEQVEWAPLRVPVDAPGVHPAEDTYKHPAVSTGCAGEEVCGVVLLCSNALSSDTHSAISRQAVYVWCVFFD